MLRSQFFPTDSWSFQVHIPREKIQRDSHYPSNLILINYSVNIHYHLTWKTWFFYCIVYILKSLFKASPFVFLFIKELFIYQDFKMFSFYSNNLNIWSTILTFRRDTRMWRNIIIATLCVFRAENGCVYRAITDAFARQRHLSLEGRVGTLEFSSAPVRG